MSKHLPGYTCLDIGLVLEFMAANDWRHLRKKVTTSSRAPTHVGNRISSTISPSVIVLLDMSLNCPAWCSSHKFRAYDAKFQRLESPLSLVWGCASQHKEQ